MAKKKAPQLYIIAGPNGAGKTTFAQTFLPQYAKCIEFINADLIARGLSPFKPESAAIGAGRLMLQKIKEMARKKMDFAFETTLSGKTYIPLINDLRQQGYAVHLIFLWLPSASLACRRVADRVKQGGHSIPKDVIKRRFLSGMLNFHTAYTPLCDTWTLIDNSSGYLNVIAKFIVSLEVFDEKAYAKITRKSGSYEKKQKV
ncbi:MAG: hypothetical protein A2268_16815 [Candidatus Raymondbacteria bacterium RifOxyA12_full_50_37]|uniref:Zeta toxin domain-containing protein n=1 Tax=Candidatus Raymondbacteria bacterium RIFOXYD12_FULL_49_13 TaxID=1817890 RepID=A0A1F7FD31_UNCRA|nr:MAG: hypothetical protein A2268_16815 [Candidatus Raymondbacteria bacterium RifOxyA12_full_50_37]OGJ86272.1 MAG: hypothetical protein A2248_16410 [Candidatus Raymondbacteria bacterium RIFOXYA2_FULL_49_16]OGJ93624.1 MAG: hypothetical protein A2487_20200 [Candidatus Raymondbacteria bacterium RifOxyC12_full_50_8]OGJ95809.1 MAG: hypothetical protein A2453_11725 [Candidatus Raymondbacteria bacterium RIFOXYC2_FULL_50_21]OGJ99060.1 MAG: hypothetical protein A2350_17355 [Candidatus Raymondbacteria b